MTSKCKKGFTLIEASIGISIVILTVAALMGVYGQGYYLSFRIKNRAIAYNLARGKLEEEFVWPPTASNEGYGAIPGFANFRRTTTTANYVFAGQLARIDVTVFWDDDFDAVDDNSVTVSTLKANF